MFLWQQRKKEKNTRTPYEFGINRNNLLTFNGGVYVPNQGLTKQFILDECIEAFMLPTPYIRNNFL